MERLKSSLEYIFYKVTQKWTLLGVLLVVAVLSWVAVNATAKTGHLEVYFFDVGQGDAIFIVLPDGRQILIDGGANETVLEKLNAVMPFWDRSIDLVIATHADADHITGLVPVLEHYDVEAVIWNGVEADTKVFEAWNEAVALEQADVTVGRCCMRFTLSDIAFFEILHPTASTGTVPVDARSSQNDFSIVIRFVYGDDSFLFTGDIERRAEYEVVSQNLHLESDVLKIAHHGSKTSSSEVFLEGVNPQVAVISSGRSNPYGHPHEAILQRLEDYGIHIRRTDLEGDILVLSNGNSF